MGLITSAYEGWPDSSVARNVARLYALIAGDIRNGTKTAPSFRDAVTLHEVIDAIEHSAAEMTALASATTPQVVLQARYAYRSQRQVFALDGADEGFRGGVGVWSPVRDLDNPGTFRAAHPPAGQIHLQHPAPILHRRFHGNYTTMTDATQKNAMVRAFSCTVACGMIL